MIRYLCVAFVAAETLTAPTGETTTKEWDALEGHPAALDVPTDLDAALADVKNTYEPAEPTAAPSAGIDSELAALRAHLHAGAAEAAPEAGVSDMLAAMHQRVHDLHSSLHTTLDDTL